MIPRLNRNIHFLWIGQFISVLGDSALWTALIFIVLALNPPNASTKAGIVGFMETFPYMAFGLFAGAIGDRFDRRRVMWISDLARMCILMLVPLSYVSGFLDWRLVAGVAFGFGLFSALFNPARDALIPDLSGKNDLLMINSFFQTSSQFAVIGGTGLAAVFLGVTGVVHGSQELPRLVAIFGLDALTFLISAVFILMIKTPSGISGGADGAALIHGRLRKIFRMVRSDSLLSGLLFITAIDNFFIMGPASVGANLLIRQTLKRGPESLALLEFILAIGMLVSSMALLKWGKHLHKGKLVLTGIILDGLTFIPFMWIRNFYLLLAAVFIHSLSIPLIIVPRTTLIQSHVSRSNLAQAFSLINLTIFGFWSLSGLTTGWLTSLFGRWVGPAAAPPLVFLVAGVGGALCGIMGLSFKGLRTAR